MKKNGFILMEILLSIVILGTVLATTIEALAYFTRMSSSSRNMDTASALLQEMLAEINSGQFREGTSDGKTTDNVFSWNVNGSRTSDFEMRYKVTIRWSERGVEKDLESTITKLDIKDRI